MNFPHRVGLALPGARGWRARDHPPDRREGYAQSALGLKAMPGDEEREHGPQFAEARRRESSCGLKSALRCLRYRKREVPGKFPSREALR